MFSFNLLPDYRYASRTADGEYSSIDDQNEDNYAFGPKNIDSFAENNNWFSKRSKDEELKLVTHPHPIYYIREFLSGLVLSLFIAPLFLVYILFQTDISGEFLLMAIGASFILFVIGAVIVFIEYLKLINNYFVVTTEQIVTKEGIFIRKTDSSSEISLENVEEKKFGQDTLFEVAVNSGDILLNTASGGGEADDFDTTLSNIPNPGEVNSILNDVKPELRRS